jgi:hypothetical protein
LKTNHFTRQTICAGFCISFLFAGCCGKKEANPVSPPGPVKTYSVTITVVDSLNQPRKGAKAWATGHRDTVTTDCSGKAMFELPAGTQAIGLAFGQEQKTATVVITSQDSVSIPHFITFGPITMMPVHAILDDPQGKPFGGVRVWIDSTRDTVLSDSYGKATLNSPCGSRLFKARLGVFIGEIHITVSPCDTALSVPALRLVLDPSVKVLVATTPAETIQTLLPAIGFTIIDSIAADSLTALANRDSAKCFEFLKNYPMVFLNCDGADGIYNANIFSVLGQYISSGGVAYGGHYAFRGLQQLFPGYYQQGDIQDLSPNDTLLITDTALSSYVGYSSIAWQSTDDRGLSGYEKFDDLPPDAKVLAVIKNAHPQVGVIVENRLGLGRFLWTNFHSQDIVSFSEQIKLLKYVLYDAAELR